MATGRRGRPKARPTDEELELAESRELAEVPAGPELEDDVIGELGDDDSRFIVAVWRRVETGPKVGKAEYLYRLSPAEFSLDAVRDRSGGGTYEFRVLKRDERGKEKYHRTRTMHLAGAPKLPAVEGGQLSGAPVAVVPPPPGSASDELRQIREEISRSRRRVARLTRELEESRKNKAPTWLKELAPILAPILAPFFKPARSGTEEFVRALELGVKLGGRGGGSDREGDGVLGTFLDKVTPAFVGALTDGKQNGAANGAPHTAPGLPPGAENGAGAAGVSAHKIMPVWLQRAAPYFAVLHAWARAGDDPAGRVETVLSALDESTRDELGKASEAEGFVAQTLAALPPVFRQPDVVTWMTRFLQLLQDKLAPEELEA